MVVTPRGVADRLAERALIGRRVAWDEVEGTIVDIGSTSNGYARYVVEWDPGAPDWWSTTVAPSSSGLRILP
jgi:hypothetical protein